MKIKLEYFKIHKLCNCTNEFSFLFSAQTQAIKALQIMSTGTKSPILSGSQFIECKTPFPVVTAIPTAPFKLSIQPGIGSFKLFMTSIRN